jgi:1,4-alpha-glucan branching enzyme
VKASCWRSLYSYLRGSTPGRRDRSRDGRVRFRVRATRAESVYVVGSWDDWTTPGAALVRATDPGLWEGWVELPPGSHRYRFLIDGQATRPVGAPRYQRDDFGEEDGVFDVPPAVSHPLVAEHGSIDVPANPR